MQLLKLVLFLLVLFFFQQSYAQKPAIDSSVFGKWPDVKDAQISNDEKYILYFIDNKPIGSQTLVLRSANGRSEQRFSDAPGPASFSADSHKAIVQLKGDSLAICRLNQNHIDYFTHVNSFVMGTDAASDWLAMRIDTSYVIQNLQTNKTYEEANTSFCQFNDADNSVLLLVQTSKATPDQKRLIWLDLANGKSKTIWEGTGCDNITLNNNGKQLAFVSQDANSLQSYDLWIYRKGDTKANLLVSKNAAGIEQGYFLINSDLLFSQDGNTLFFKVKKDEIKTDTAKSFDGVNVWNYKDKQLQSAQLKSLGYSDSVENCAINLQSHQTTTLNRPDERVDLEHKSNNKFVLVQTDQPDEAYYNKDHRPTLFLESIKSGLRNTIKEHIHLNTDPILSPNEDFVIWFDLDRLAYMSYEVKTGLTHNLSSQVPDTLYSLEAAKFARIFPFKTTGWSHNGERLLIYSNYDIWEIDPAGIARPKNLTQGLGQKNHIVFGMIPGKTIPYEKDILISGFNKENKENGFWLIDTTGNHAPKKLIMDAYTYYIARTGQSLSDYETGEPPIKASEANQYLVTRQDCRESPNLFLTKDFKSFQQISHTYPEKKYNWMTDTLVTWKMSDGQMSQGVLYKPENFDPAKKYPVIFYIYERLSDGLNSYRVPDLSHDDLNIAWYVSNGYLIFLPDIHYKLLHGGQSVVNSVVSATKYLSKLPWVDSTKMGLQGHSFGGWETNFVITHSHLFAAACEASGVCDITSAYGQVRSNGSTFAESFETYQGPFGLGVTPWTNSKAYIDNSPIFFIDSVGTPLLMAHGRQDQAIPYDQAVEFFVGLKRAGKKVWLLDYDQEGHSFYGEAAKDYTIRMQQYFDHYLKGAPAPKWMVDGIPAEKKGKENGYALMPSNND